MKGKKAVLIILGLLILFSLSTNVDAQEAKRRFWIAELGGLWAGNQEGQPWEFDAVKHNGKYAVARVGLSYALVPEKFDWIFVVGPAILFTGGEDDPSKSFFTATTTFKMRFTTTWWFGAGITYATAETDGDNDETNWHLTANTGIDLNKTDSRILTLFFEWQHPMRYAHARGKGGSCWFKAILGVQLSF
jgi:hypothetical protein